MGATEQRDYRADWEEAARHTLRWRKRAEDLEEAIHDYFVWEPGRRGYAAAHKRLRAVLMGEDGEEC